MLGARYVGTARGGGLAVHVYEVQPEQREGSPTGNEGQTIAWTTFKRIERMPRDTCVASTHAAIVLLRHGGPLRRRQAAPRSMPPAVSAAQTRARGGARIM